MKRDKIAIISFTVSILTLILTLTVIINAMRTFNENPSYTLNRLYTLMEHQIGVVWFGSFLDILRVFWIGILIIISFIISLLPFKFREDYLTTPEISGTGKFFSWFSLIISSLMFLVLVLFVLFVVAFGGLCC